MENNCYPLSVPQLGIYYECKKDESLTTYNLPFAVRLPHSTDVLRLEKAICSVFAAHPSLGMIIGYEDGVAVQRYSASEKPVIGRHTVAEAEMEQIKRDYAKPFVMDGAPLYRIDIYETEKSVHLVYDIHHIVSDGTSNTIFLTDLFAAYDGTELVSEQFTVGEHARCESLAYGGAKYKEDKAFFASVLEGVEMPSIAKPNLKEEERTGLLRRVEDKIPMSLVNDFCRSVSTTPNTLFAASLSLCLSRMVREDKVAFCTVHNGRLDSRIGGSIGMFVKTLPVVVGIEKGMDVKGLLSEIRGYLKNLWKRQDYPFAEIVENFGVNMEISYTFQHKIKESFEVDGGSVALERLGRKLTSGGMNIFVLEHDKEYLIRIEYNSSLFDDTTASNIATSMRNVVSAMIATPSARLEEISLVDTAERERVLGFSRGVRLPVDENDGVLAKIRRQAAVRPDKAAVVYKERIITYGELDASTDKIAATLRQSGIGRGDIVGIISERTEQMILLPTGVLKSGAAYMPIDTALPEERIAFMLQDAGVKLILTDTRRKAIEGYDGDMLSLGELMMQDTDGEDAAPLPEPASDDMFVLLYTSGSTGTPKGCMLEHGSLSNFCETHSTFFNITDSDSTLAYANFAFDAHMIDIYPMLTRGGTVHVISGEDKLNLVYVNDYIERCGITVVFFTTQIGRQFVEDFDNKSLRVLMLGGESLTGVRQPRYDFYNIYGPTECTLYVTEYKVEGEFTKNLIGRPMPNTDIYVLDKSLQLLPVGVSGELCIGGRCVGRGYLNREELTQEKFVEVNGERLYRTGDLVRWTEEGEIEYLHRMDGQVKLRGLRIETGEIESRMSTYPGVRSAVVDVKEIGGVQYLCGYITGDNEIDTVALSLYIGETLPDYMIPSGIVQIEEFPLTPNGKVNRRVLPLPQIETGETVLPATEEEKNVYSIVSELLPGRDFGVTTNLLSAGLTSILAIKLSVQLNTRLSLDIPTKEILQHKTIRKILASATTATTEIQRYTKRGSYPLTENQKGLYYEWEKDREALQYNIPYRITLPGSVDSGRLKDAVARVIDAHPYLKTTLAVEGEEVVQLRRDEAPVEIEYEKGVSEESVQTAVASFVRPFNLLGDTLYRISIYDTGEHVYLLTDIHHIIYDGSSTVIFYRDLTKAYGGDALEEEPFTAYDESLREEELERSEVYTRAEEYFAGLLGGVEMTRLPSSKSLPAEQELSRIRFVLPSAAVGNIAEKTGITVGNLFLSALLFTLNRYTREDTVSVLTVSSGRDGVRLSDTVGMFVKTLPVVSTVNSSARVSDFMRSVQEQLYSTLGNDIYPFTRMSERYGLLPQISYVYEGGMEAGLTIDGTSFFPEGMARDTVKFPFTIITTPVSDGYDFVLEYDSGSYTESDIEIFASAYRNVVSAMASTPSARLEEISLVDTGERERVLGFSRGVRLPVDENDGVLAKIRRQAAVRPDKAAVVYKERIITYGELDASTDKIAATLRQSGIGRGDIVGIISERTEQMILLPTGVLKSGAAYMPIDTALPEERIAFMLQDAGVKLILTDTRRKAIEGYDGDMLSLGELMMQDTDGEDAAPLPEPASDDMFVLLYTSGSTGTPKGCMLEHGSLSNFCETHSTFFNITDSDSTLAYANFAFDAHMIDIYPMLTRGGTVHVISGEDKLNLVYVNDYIERCGITVVFFTTQIGRQFVEDFDNKSLRVLMLGGESLTGVRQPRYDFYNIYGPTECTLYVTEYKVEGEFTKNLIGRPMPNTDIYVLDKSLQLLPVGVSGELCIGGRCVGRGYLNREELTQEKFVEVNGERLYRTGDLVRWTEEGEIEYLHRMDGQVKLRGLRIETGEIESRMSTYPGVRSAVVDVKEIGGVQYLCGYITGDNEIDTVALSLYIGETLPDYMIPSGIVQIEEFPLTPNGKVNRRVLPLPQIETGETVLPATEEEKNVYSIVSELLPGRDFGVTTNLLSAGLTSILAIKLSVQLNTRLSLDIPTKEILQHKTIRKILASATTATTEIQRYTKRGSYPLTENQKGLYYEWEKDREALQYNIPYRITLPGSVDSGRLKDAVARVIDAHPYLKTTLAVEGEEVVQLRRDEAPVEIEYEKGVSEESVQTAVASFVRPFNLLGDTLYRISIYDTGEHVYLLTDIHHIIYDGSSTVIFYRDLTKAYGGDALEEEPFTAYDESLREEELERSEVYTRAEEYFAGLLGGVEMTRLPSSKSLPAEQELSRIRFVLPSAAVGNIAEKTGITVGNLFLSALLFTLNRYTREDTVSVLTVSSGRDGVRLSDTVGMFVKTLPVVSTVNSSARVSDFMRSVQEQLYSTLGNDIYPFTRMSERYALVPQVNYVFEGGMEAPLVLDGVCYSPETMALDAVKMPFSVIVSPSRNGYRVVLEYDASLYSVRDAELFASAYNGALSNMLASPDARMGDVSLLDDTERAHVLALSKGRAMQYDTEHLLVERMMMYADADSERVALVDSVSEMTYGELNRRSSALAVELVKLGVERNSFVAIMMPRVNDYIVALLAVHKAGAAFVPVDSEYPNDRISYMLKDSGARLLVTVSSLYDEKSKEGDIVAEKLLFLDMFDYDTSFDASSLRLPDGDDMAYMIYTSGTTGLPKGVVIRQKSLLAFAAWCSDDMALTRDDKVLLHISFSFDASLSSIAPMLYAGASLYIVSSEMRRNMVSLVEYINNRGITAGVFPTQMGVELLNQFDTCMRVVALGGEKLKPVRTGGTVVFNAFGPTEFTVASSMYRIDPERKYDSYPIGLPAQNTWQYVVDADMNLLPAGVPGELCLSGIQIAAGYWKRPDVTAAKFVANPYSDSPDNALMYRTGDLVAWNSDGELEYMGRMDGQIKLRGLRIELGEVESRVGEFHGIASAAAAVKEIGGVQHLCAYYVSQDEVDLERLKEFIGETLPDYMVPSGFMRVDALPLTPNGKVNRKALPVPQIVSTVEYAEPETELERNICTVYGEILGSDKVGANDNFFESGGTSILAIKAIIKIINLGYKIEYGDMFKLKTPRKIAAFLEGDAGAEQQNAVRSDGTDIADYDYSAINEVLSRNVFSDTKEYPRRSFKRVLLCGATGYLGLHLLKELIESEVETIYCMVRKRRELSAAETLSVMLMYYFSETYEELMGSRIIPVETDITDRRFMELLGGKGIDAVFNAAAIVKHYAVGDEIDRVNVGGVANLIEFCRRESARLIQISTGSVSGTCNERDMGRMSFDEKSLYIGQHISNRYVLSKFLAERLVLQGIADGLDAKIMRVGNLMGRNSDGEFQINFGSNAFVNMLKSYKFMGMYPTVRLTSPVEISPIDCVVRGILSLSRLPSDITVLHPYNNYTTDMASLLFAMREYGFPIDFVSEEVFAAKMDSMMKDEKDNERVSGLLHYGSRKGERNVPMCNSFTTTMLYTDNICWPMAGDDYAMKFIKVLDGMGLFD